MDPDPDFFFMRIKILILFDADANPDADLGYQMMRIRMRIRIHNTAWNPDVFGDFSSRVPYCKGGTVRYYGVAELIFVEKLFHICLI